MADCVGCSVADGGETASPISQGQAMSPKISVFSMATFLALRNHSTLSIMLTLRAPLGTENLT